MDNNTFIKSAKEIIENVVNALANKDYSGFARYIELDSSWVEPEKTIEESCISFGEWLDEQLKMWEDDYGKEMRIDHFDETALEDMEVVKERIIVTYDPTSNGERLDFWFEFSFSVENEQVIGEFNVNI